MELRTKLSGGHTDTILCVATNHIKQVATGSENNQVCLWDSEVGKVNCKLHPAGTENSHRDDSQDVTSLCFSSTQPHNLYCAVDTCIYLYDTRCADLHVARFEYNKEEINQLALHPKDTYLAACDDSGQIRIIDTSQRKLYKTLRKHTNICSSVSFHPKLPWHVASGGLDCSIFTWDFSRGRPFTSLSTQELNIEDESSSVPSSYTVNPPLVHSVHYSNRGNLACGLENSTVHLLEFKKRSNVEVKRTFRGHSQGVSQVVFIKDDLLSAGNDGKIIRWNTSSADGGHGSSADGCEEETTQESAGEGIGEARAVGPSCSKHVLDHGDKPNWMCPLLRDEKCLLYVADQTDVVSVYDITMSS